MANRSPVGCPGVEKGPDSVVREVADPERCSFDLLDMNRLGFPGPASMATLPIPVKGHPYFKDLNPPNPHLRAGPTSSYWPPNKRGTLYYE